MDTKRLLDLSLLLPGSLVYGPPLALAALAVKLDDGGPVLFRQQRVGQHGRPVEVLKLRTMSTEASPGDRRVTRVGRILRQTGLDELPQFLNVLRGDMSLVGPRPLTQADLSRLEAQAPGFSRRLRDRPGITGLAQVHGTRSLAQTMQLEDRYEASAAEDLRILARTVLINLLGKERARRPTSGAPEPAPS
jgi:lipopolysaccharide/colanic/teichoic acid biosynthesis glycosyltransferase